ncbi:MAG: 50S ribosomal protein L33 [Mycoplasmatales bacterium]
MKKKIILVCEECLSVNYSTNKSKVERIYIKKYCSKCKKHTIHKENR